MIHRNYGTYYISQFTVETYCFADGRCFIQASIEVTLAIGDGRTNRFSKGVYSVGTSICNPKKKA